MSNTIVVVIGNIKEYDATFDNFKKNVIDELKADLCLCAPYDNYSNNSFFKFAKHIFLYDEQENSEAVLDYAYVTLSKNNPKYERLENINALNGKVPYPKHSTENITYYGDFETIDNFNNFDDDEVIVHTKNFHDYSWRNQVYGIKYSDNSNLVSQENVITYKKPLHWKEIFTLNGYLFKDDTLFYYWFLLKNLTENGLINKYERFVITQGDFIFDLPHPNLAFMNENCIWIPDCKQCIGSAYKHVVLSKNYIKKYLSLFANIILQSNDYFKDLQKFNRLDFDLLVKFYLDKTNILHNVKEYPYLIHSLETRKNINEFYQKNSFVSVRKSYNIKTPIKLSELDSSILSEFSKDLQIMYIDSYTDGSKSNSYDQIPDICKKYMNYSNSNFELKWSKEMIDEMIQCCDNLEYEKLSPNDYPKSSLQFVEVFKKYVNISGKNCLVLGSISPWIECLLLHFDAKHVTTLDYIIPECDYKIETLSIDNYKKEMKYDVILSFSSLEHDGLGRYGDPINPDGDIDACIEAYTMLNPGGIFICGIPIGEGTIEGNGHRIYNKKRLDKLFSLFSEFIGSVNYQTLNEELNFSGSSWKNQPIFVYKK